MSSTGKSGRNPRVLVYGYGNPGRQDDGLGVALADQLEAWALIARRPWLTFDRNYQLNAEDALEASHHDIVVFLDASQDQGEPFRFAAIQPSAKVSFSTHSMSPESVLALCRDLYGAGPAGRLLTIRGYFWEPNEAMTAGARGNLDAAREWLAPLLDSPGLLLTTRRP
jgi:hydrogenase maturation protease